MSTATTLMQIDVANLHIFDQRAGNAGDDRWIFGNRIEARDIRDKNAAKSFGRDALGASHSLAQAQKQRRVYDSAHGKIADDDVFDSCAVDTLEGQAAASIENTIRNGDISKSTF